MEHPVRKTIQLKGYDYANPGYYFITICTQHKEMLFGRVLVGADSISAQPEARKTNVGADSISAQPEARKTSVGADSISAQHGDTSTVLLNSAGEMIETIYCNMPSEFRNVVLHEHIVMPNHLHGIIQMTNADRADMESAPTLACIIQTFKRMTTIGFIEGVKNKKFEPFDNKVWQRGYYEHIIRNEAEMMRIRHYIIHNPAKWSEDEYHMYGRIQYPPAPRNANECRGGFNIRPPRGT